MMRVTQWREYTEKSVQFRVRATYGFQQLGSQEPYFSVTGEIERKHGSKWHCDGGGCVHSTIAEHFPELAGAIRWHLCGEKSGPMHYIENAKYWWSLLLQKLGTVPPAKDIARPDDAETADSFRENLLRHVIFGAVEGDELPSTTVPQFPDIVIHAWCEGRFLALLAAMRRDIESIPHEKLAPAGDFEQMNGTQQFVEKLGIKMTCERVERPNADGWPPGANHYRVKLVREDVRWTPRGRSLSTYYSMGPGLTGKPMVEDVLECLATDARAGAMNFEEFCSDFGYDTDSRKAEKSHKVCVDLRRRLEFFLEGHFEDLVGE